MTSKKSQLARVNGNNFRRFASAFFFLGSIAFLLAATPSNSLAQTGANNSLTLWHSQGANERFWQEAAYEFGKANPDIRVELSLLPRKELNSTLTFSVLTNESPDMVLLQSDLLGLQSLFNLDEVPKAWVKETVPEDNLNYVKLDGKLYGIPISYGNHLVLYYNKAIIKKPAKTWEELKDQAKQLPEGVMPLAINYRSSYTFMAFWHVFGDQVVVNERANLKTQSTVDALTFYKDIARKRIVNKSCTYACVTTDFYTGKFAYAMNGDWDYVNAKRELGENLGIALLPTIKGKQLASLKSTLVLSFPNGSTVSPKYKQLREFASFVQSKSFLRSINVKLNRQPSHIELKKELSESEDQEYLALLHQLDLSIPMPTSVAMITAWDSIHKGFRLFIDDGVSPESATAYMQKKADYELKKVLARSAK